MKTGIRTKDDICDVDDGIYFFRKPDVTPNTLQAWVLQAVTGHTETPPEHREKCIRLIFAGDYELDMPVYYSEDKLSYYLATNTNGWGADDPKEMVDWFVAQKDEAGHLIKIVKYLKAWCDYKRNKMPNGLAMTILAGNAKSKIVYNDRDDINLRDTLKEIQKTLLASFTCIVPATPNDNLFAEYDDTRKKNFLNALDAFLVDADAAIRESNFLNASKLWRKHLGDRFPLGEDKIDPDLSNPALIAGIKSSKPYAG
ncbi:MAG TPA: hypothetical protein PLL28_11135 [Chitinophagales bacterium]|nr:hypothetical protein [Chitinophagales bacterium]HNF69922.1 hypothetical protein [Chitinophagales bacterium]HNK99188.1 hypothetical protein [Chitinophagales bacterium]HNO29779.1 hypothetical protein [Chitinophagales bacterium]